jgi:DNA-binding MarR family transcriptional regulator
MHITKTQAVLLQQIHDGMSVVEGEDTHTLKRLIGMGLVAGYNGTSDLGAVYVSVTLTPEGKAIVVDLLID